METNGNLINATTAARLKIHKRFFEDEWEEIKREHAANALTLKIKRR